MSVGRIVAVLFCLLSLWGCTSLEEHGEIGGEEWPTQVRPLPLDALKMDSAELPQGSDALEFVVRSPLKSELSHRRFSPISRYLEETLGQPINMRVVSTYDELITIAVNGDFHIILLTPLSYVVAKDQVPNLQPVVSMVAYGVPTYSSFVLVRSDDPARSLADLQGRRIAYVDRRSASGFLMPANAFLGAGLDPLTSFKEAHFAGNHLLVLEMLARGEVDAAATGSGIVSIIEEMTEGVLDGAATRFRILAQAGRVPYDALCARGDLKTGTVDKIRGAMERLNNRTAQGRAVLAASRNISGWIGMHDSDYEPLRRVYRAVHSRLESGPPAEGAATP